MKSWLDIEEKGWKSTKNNTSNLTTSLRSHFWGLKYIDKFSRPISSGFSVIKCKLD